MNALYRTVWRWHFYAGLLVMPFVVVLSLTGAAYLFKPQIDRWEEQAFHGTAIGGAVDPADQVGAAVAAYRGSRFESYLVPERPGDASMVLLALADGGMRDVFVAGDGRVVGSFDPEARITMVLASFHGSLLLGPVGDILVELAASWAFLLILSGLYLWWPRGRGAAGTIWPRRGAGLRDLHAVTGFWVAGLALAMLASGLPWAGLWGPAFQAARTELGLVQGRPDWKVGTAAPQHAAHDHDSMLTAIHGNEAESLALLGPMVRRAREERLAFPALVLPPGAPQRFGPPSEGWTIKSEAQNRTLVRSVRFDAAGRELGRSGFADKHPVDRVVNIGIAWHEGQLFGLANQLIGLVTAFALVSMAVTSFLMWRRRKPAGALGAPRAGPLPQGAGYAGFALVTLGVLLPLLGLSLLVLLAFDRLVLPRWQAAARWLAAA